VRRVLKVVPFSSAVLAALFARSAAAQPLTIDHPGAHPPFSVELEPHLALGVSDPPGPGVESGIGAGLRASFEIADNAFVPRIDDSVAIGVGADWLHYSGNGDARSATCARFVTGTSGNPVCVEVSGAGGRSNYLFVPVDLQWNFWLSSRWSAFVEPGLSLYWLDGGHLGVTPAFSFGGRVHLTPKIALTLRIGYPTFTLGASFFL
jgi:hypothetical protein